MIKNNAQLAQAKERLSVVNERLNSYKNNPDDFSSQSMTISIEKEKLKLEADIEEYLLLRDLPFEESINAVLNKHMLLDNIGELLSKIRIAAKKSQSDLSKELGWEQSNLSRFESENYSSQTINKIVEYASSLGIYLHVKPSFQEDVDVEKGSIVYSGFSGVPAFRGIQVLQGDISEFFTGAKLLNLNPETVEFPSLPRPVISNAAIGELPNFPRPVNRNSEIMRAAQLKFERAIVSRGNDISDVVNDHETNVSGTAVYVNKYTEHKDLDLAST